MNPIIYQIYIKSFHKGTIRGITEKVDYLSGLGIDVIWISPFYSSGGTDGGYDIIDHTKIDPEFGTLLDIKNLIKTFHDNGIKVIIDLVLNHTSDQSEWFINSINRREGMDDWYVWKNKDQLPINWESEFEDCPWTFSEKRGQYYYHYFYKTQPDLNLNNLSVQNEVFKIIDFWLDLNIDGFRLDAVSCFFENDGIENNNQYRSSQLNQDKTFDFLSDIRTHINDKYSKNIILLGETEIHNPDDPIRFLKSMDYIMNYDIAYMDTLDPIKFKREIIKWDKLNKDNGRSPLYYFNNHDRNRCRYGEDNPLIAKLMATLLLLQDGTKIIYYGEEIGLTNGLDLGIDKIGRDGCRCPMPWYPWLNQVWLNQLRLKYLDDKESEYRMYLPYHNSENNNVEKQLENKDSVLHWYIKMIKLSKDLIGRIEFKDIDEDKNILWFKRPNKNDKVIDIILNMSSSSIPLSCIKSNDDINILESSNYDDIDGIIGAYGILIYY